MVFDLQHPSDVLASFICPLLALLLMSWWPQGISWGRCLLVFYLHHMLKRGIPKECENLMEWGSTTELRRELALCVCVCLSLSTLTFCCSAFTHEPSLQNPTMMSSFPFNFFLCESLKLLKAGFISVVMQGERILSGAGEKNREEHKNYRTQDSDALVFSLKT